MTSTATQHVQEQSGESFLKRTPWDRLQSIETIGFSPRYAPRRPHHSYERPQPDTACEVSKWTNSRLKRFVDFSAALFLLVLLAPVLWIVYCIVRIDSSGPAIFSQERVGKDQSRFTIYKFRTMAHVSGRACFVRSGPTDSRLTKRGPFLRKYKLDELPQLVNVLRGEMSLVGPRPKLPELHIGQLPCRPGLTGQASLAFAAEAGLLKDVPAHVLEEFHTTVITPMKLELDQDYMRMASFVSDMAIIWQTVLRQGCYREVADLHCRADNTPVNA